MRIKLLAGAALAAVMAASGASAAENGWYGAVDIGWHVTDNYEMKSSFTSAPSGPLNYHLYTDDDFTGFSRLGYRVAPNWRVEGELGFRSGDITGFKNPGVYPGFGVTVTTGTIAAVGAAPAINYGVVTVGSNPGTSGPVNVAFSFRLSGNVAYMVGAIAPRCSGSHSTTIAGLTYSQLPTP